MPEFFELVVTYADENLTLHSPHSNQAKAVLPAIVGLVPGKNNEMIHSVGISADIVAEDIAERKGRIVNPFARHTFEPHLAASAILYLVMRERKRRFPDRKARGWRYFFLFGDLHIRIAIEGYANVEEPLRRKFEREMKSRFRGARLEIR